MTFLRLWNFGLLQLSEGFRYNHSRESDKEVFVIARMLTLQRVTPQLAQSLWEQGNGRPGWPDELYTEAAFQSMVDQQDMAETLSSGMMRVFVNASGNAVGYGLCNVIPDVELRLDETAVEMGTYLLPVYRGQGFNLPAKKAMIRFVSRRYQASWCVFLVPRSNPAGLRAMEKLPWDVQRFTTNSPGPFQTFLRRRNWQTSTDCVLFAIRPTGI